MSPPLPPARPRRRGVRTAAALAALVTAALISPFSGTALAADESLSVDFATTGPAPSYLGAGTIYGMTEDARFPQDHFYRDIRWNYMRAGGAQLDNPGGWVGGTYPRRWAATRAQAQRTAALGGQFVLLVHDLWGADAETRANVFPGDNGDWSSYDAFLTQLINDVRATGLPIQWDLWNEPDLGLFWGRSQAQYLAMWERGYRRVTAALPGVTIVGPSASQPPSTSNGWWTTYLDFVTPRGLLPTIYSWHDLPGDPVATTRNADALLASRGITRTTRYQINEYASPEEQTPGDGAWYLARLERAGAVGLRANWALGQRLNNDLADLLVRNSAGQYQPTGEWWAYRYYGSQTGNTVTTVPSASYDAFATKTAGSARILIGGGGTTGNVAVTLRNIGSVSGLVSNNQVRVLVQRLPDDNGAPVAGPVTVSNQVVTLTNGGTTVNVRHDILNDASTITLLPPSDTSFTSVAVAQHSGQCLDNTNLATANGNQQQQYFCEGGDQQQWRFVPTAGVADTFSVINQQSGKCLDVSALSTADGAAVQQWDCTGGTNQQFTLRKVTYSGAGAQDYQLVARHSGKCVDVSAVSTAARQPVHQWTCVPASQGDPRNQTWRLLGR